MQLKISSRWQGPERGESVFDLESPSVGRHVALGVALEEAEAEVEDVDETEEGSKLEELGVELVAELSVEDEDAEVGMLEWEDAGPEEDETG